MLSSIAVVKEVFCKIKRCEPRSCVLNETIDSDNFVMVSESENDVNRFESRNNPNVEHLPRQIAKKFPKLRNVAVNGCGLTVVRDFYFENMWMLKKLSLDENKITIIEPQAFSDLMNVEFLSMNGNLIVTLDEKLFQTMSTLRRFFLSNNRVKFLSPETLDIPNSDLRYVDLTKNDCIDEIYDAGDHLWFERK